MPICSNGAQGCDLFNGITANVPIRLILFTLMLEATRSSEMSVITRATRRHNPDDGILPSHRSENLTSYIALTGRAL
jgi:hypothetical protein